MSHPTEAEECWQCGHQSEHSLFCRFCDSLQAPESDYFRFLGIEPKLSIDPMAIQKRFYDLSRLLHPDRYTRRTATEQQYSLEATAILNDAYRVLRDPVSRAEYVLRQKGFEGTEPRSKNVAPEMLEEVFEMNMALEELRSGDQQARPQLEMARDKFVAIRKEMDYELERLFDEHDASKSREVLAELRTLLDRRKYVQNLVVQVEKELAA
ncbi:MAG: Fe-S protein assembly co-chaperone HscB [bacterium]|nr:Fe-S protein assembly co-chaperone HscB [bacterium]